MKVKILGVIAIGIAAIFILKLCAPYFESPTATIDISPPSKVVTPSSTVGSIPTHNSHLIPTPLTDVESIFRKAFNRPMPKQYYPVTAQLFLDRHSVSQVPVFYNPLSGQLKLPKTQLLTIFKENLVMQKNEDLQALSATDGYWREAQLESLGFDVRFNQRQSILYIDCPSGYRASETVYLTRWREKDATVDRFPVSGYVNLRNYVDRDYYRLKLETNLNVNGWVTESEFNYLPEREQDFFFEGARLIRDNPMKKTRMTIGHVEDSRLFTPFQFDVIGIGLTRHWHQQPNYDYMVHYDKIVNLDTDSQVTIQLNQRTLYNQSLRSGEYHFKSFPLQYGKNKIQFTLVQPDGVKETKTKYIYRDLELLSQTQSQFLYQLGYPTRFTDATIARHDALSGMAYYRKGITNQWTVGAYTQVQDFYQLLGLVSHFGTPMGMLKLGTSTSLIENSNSGYSTQIELRSYLGNYASKKRLGIEQFSLRVNYYSDDYKVNYDGISNSLGGQPEYEISPFVNIRLAPRLVTRLIASYRRDRDPGLDTSSVGSHFILFHGLLRSQLSFDYSFQDEDVNIRYLMTLNTLGNRHQIQYDQKENSRDIDWYYRPVSDMSLGILTESDDNELNSIGARFNYHNFYAQYTDGDTQKSRLGYHAQRGLVTLQHESDGDQDTQSLNLDTAIVFAGKHVAISKPVYDSFAILYPHPSLKGKKVKYNRGAKIDWMGPAVISNLGSYRTTAISPTEIDHTIGLSQVIGHYIHPSYGSGTAIQVGNDNQFSVLGYFVSSTGEPIPHLFARLTGSKEDTIFSNSNGRFYAIDLAPGDYQIQFPNGQYKPITITVHDNDDLIQKVGELILKEQQSEV